MRESHRALAALALALADTCAHYGGGEADPDEVAAAAGAAVERWRAGAYDARAAER